MQVYIFSHHGLLCTSFVEHSGEIICYYFSWVSCARTSHRPFRVLQPCARLVGHVVLLKEPDLFAHRCFPFLRRIKLRGSTLV